MPTTDQDRLPESEPVTPISRRRLLQLAGATGLAISGGAVLGCGGGSSASSKGSVGFNQPYNNTEVHKPLIAGAMDQAEADGYKLLQSFANGDVAKQLNELETWIAAGVKGITLFPIDLKTMRPTINTIREKDIKLVGYAGELPGEDGSVLFDDLKGAKAVAEQVADTIKTQFGGEAKLATLRNDTIAVGKLRVDTMVSTLEAQIPGIKVNATADANDASQALKATRSILQAEPDINVIVCINDDCILGANQAMQEKERDLDSYYLAGMDGSKEAMTAIVEGRLPGVTGALPLKAIGAASVWTLAHILEGKGPTKYVADYILVTKEKKAEARKLIADFG